MKILPLNFVTCKVPVNYIKVLPLNLWDLLCPSQLYEDIASEFVGLVMSQSTI